MRFRRQSPPELEHDDAALARRMLDGDRSAFDDFFEGRYPGLYRFALARLGGEEELAQDVAQTAIVKAMTHLASYRGEASLTAWLYTICRHEIGAVFRRRKRTPTPVELVEDDPELGAVLDSLPAGLESPDEALRRKEVVRLVHSVLDRLPSRHGDVLEWKYLHGLSVKEIASRLEVGPKAAESLLTRARQTFRDALEALERRSNLLPFQRADLHLEPPS